MEGLVVVCPVCDVASSAAVRCDQCKLIWLDVANFQRWFVTQYDLTDPEQLKQAQAIYPHYFTHPRFA
jgi:Zn-finger nucleic acid-binding protein